MEIYKKIADAATLHCEQHKELILSRYSEVEVENIEQFFTKHVRNFYINKNSGKPRYILKEINGVLQTFDNGVPKLIIAVYNRGKKETIYKELIPKEEVDGLLKQYHHVEFNGIQSCQPCSENKLTKMFNDKYYFLGLQKMVKRFLKNCQTCKLNNTLPQTSLAPPLPIRTFYPHERLQFDLIYIASKKKKYLKNNPWGFQYILSIKDTFSKYCWLFPLKIRDAPSVLHPLQFLCEKEGFPEIFQSDNGKEFVAKVISSFLKRYGVQIKRGKPYHPQSQGQVENLNKIVKQHLSRLLQKMEKTEAAKTWPVLLPGVASIINNTWHQTIDDIPFRIYHNREPRSVASHYLPDDGIWSSQQLDPEEDSDLDENEDEESDGDDEELEEGYFGEKLISENEILQSCASASLSSKVFSQRGGIIETEPEELANQGFLKEEEFSATTFQMALYTLSKESQFAQLQALESTEYGIHRNIRRVKKMAFGQRFKIGDKVLIRNPDCQNKKGGVEKNLLQTRNVVGVVNDVLRGGMYNLSLGEGHNSFQKDVFVGQMVLFSENETEAEEGLEDKSERKTRKEILEEISKFGEDTREAIFESRKRSFIDIGKGMEDYFHTLDLGVLSKIFGLNGDVEKETEVKTKYQTEWEKLEQKDFPYFMYGTVAWERTRKLNLPKEYYDVSASEEHDCGECFNQARECNHLCCQSKLVEYASCMGFKMIKAQKNDENQPEKNRNKNKKDVAQAKSKPKPKTKSGIKKDFTLTFSKKFKF